MRLLSAVLILLILAVQYRIWVSDDGLPGVWRLQRAVAQERAQTQNLAQRNQRLAAEVRDLKEGMDAIESRARSELGMIGKGEVLYQFTDR